MTEAELKCPIKGHDHLRLLHGDGSLRCPKDNHRWVPVTADLAKSLAGAPEIILKSIKPETIEGKMYIRRSRPHWGWPRGWKP